MLHAGSYGRRTAGELSPGTPQRDSHAIEAPAVTAAGPLPDDLRQALEAITVPADLRTQIELTRAAVRSRACSGHGRRVPGKEKLDLGPYDQSGARRYHRLDGELEGMTSLRDMAKR